MIVVHTTPTCMPCRAVKRWLLKNDLPFEERPITPESADRFKALGILVSPVVELPDQPPHGGYRVPLLEKYRDGLASPPQP